MLSLCTSVPDALALRYGWLPNNMPSTCDCGKHFTVEHALSCAKGGFPSITHNEIRDITVTLPTEGMGNEATTFFKLLASLLAEKWDSHYSSTLSWLRCRLSFSLLRSTIQTIRGERSSTGHAAAPHITAIDLINFRILYSQ